MRNAHEVLVGLFPQIDLLLPFGVLANHECSNPLFYKQVNDAMGGDMQVVINLARPLVGQSL